MSALSEVFRDKEIGWIVAQSVTEESRWSEQGDGARFGARPDYPRRGFEQRRVRRNFWRGKATGYQKRWAE